MSDSEAGLKKLLSKDWRGLKFNVILVICGKSRKTLSTLGNDHIPVQETGFKVHNYIDRTAASIKQPSSLQYYKIRFCTQNHWLSTLNDLDRVIVAAVMKWTNLPRNASIFFNISAIHKGVYSLMFE